MSSTPAKIGGISLAGAAKKPTTLPPRKPAGPPKPKKPLAGFAAPDDDDEDEDDGAAAGVFARGGGAKPKPAAKGGKDRGKVNAQLATFTGLSQREEQKAAQAAEDVDPNIFDYDAAWDAQQNVQRRKKALDAVDAAERKPKYMENLLVSAEVRKRDQLRAKEKLLQKEREEEGDEFADKESFVTEAYKKQQAELLKLEEEERAREENMKKKSQGMSTFYRNMLDKTESKHDELVAASTAKDAADSLPAAAAADPDPASKSADALAQELRDKGAAVEVNEEGQVVDKTQLLAGGLNVVAKPKGAAKPAGPSPYAHRQQQNFQGKRKVQDEMRARQTKMIEDQLAQVQKRALDEEAAAHAELEQSNKSRKTEGDVSSARERYLQRKREAEAAKARGEAK